MAFAIASLLSLLLGPSAHGAETGSVSGRVLNPATQQYVANVEVGIRGTLISAVTSQDGSYLLQNVPAGSAVVEVNYSGYATSTAAVTVTAGQTTTRDFDLVPVRSTAAGKGEEDVMVLATYVVSAEREGNSKAIMDQKKDMNITTAIASDSFGNVTDGNVGEFLKFLPGIDLDYVESQTRGPRLGGLDTAYTGVTINGQKIASADANRANSRGTSFEAFSINAIESIEVFRTTSPDLPSDSPAGTINLKTKRAFDFKGRRMGYSLSASLNSEEFQLGRTPGPGGKSQGKMRANGGFDFGDVFLKNRLGVIFSYSHANSYSEQYREQFNIDRVPTATDPRPLVITNLLFKDGPTMIQKDTFSLVVDAKVTPSLTLSNTLIYNYASAAFFNREFTFNAVGSGRRSQVLGDGVTEIQTNPTTPANERYLRMQGTNAAKLTNTITWMPRFEYRLGSWTFDGGGNWSRSRNRYHGMASGFVRAATANDLQNVSWVARRPDPMSNRWSFQQLSGADFSQLSSRTNPRISDEGRFASTEVYSGDINARWVTPIRRFPTSLKIGAKISDEERITRDRTQAKNWNYIGPNGGSTGSFVDFVNPNVWSTGGQDLIRFHDQAGNPTEWQVPDPHALNARFSSNPEQFAYTLTPENYYTAYIASLRQIRETVAAGYGMFDTKISSQLQFRAGVRWEETELTATNFDPYSRREVIAAGYTVATSGTLNGRANTIPGLEYQYLSRPRTRLKSKYGSGFPMAAIKYIPLKNLQVHAGWNKAISRPPVDQLSGPWWVDDVGSPPTIYATNPNLKPEYSKNLSARVAYYFEPAGELSVTVNQNDIRNKRLTYRRPLSSIDPSEFPLVGDPEYAGYDVQAPFNQPNPVRVRSMSVSWRQTLPFKHALLKNITVNAAYTRAYADQRGLYITPNLVTANIGYRYRAFSARAGVVWRGDTPWGGPSDRGYVRRHDTKVDLNVEYKFSRHLTLFVAARNALNEGQTWVQSPGTAQKETEGAILRLYENYGANWLFGVKGSF